MTNLLFLLGLSFWAMIIFRKGWAGQNHVEAVRQHSMLYTDPPDLDNLSYVQSMAHEVRQLHP